MSDAIRDSPGALEEIRADIVERLRSRRLEIVQAIYARIQDAVPDPVRGKDPEYQAGVLAAITELLDHSLVGIERGPEWLGPIPPAAAAQARRAARAGVSTGTVLRRYVAGHGELGRFIAEETQRRGFTRQGSELRHLHRTQEALLEHLTAAIEHEHNQECGRSARSPERRRAELVQKLLAGEHVDPTDMVELDYELHASWHLGVIATGTGAGEALRGLKAGLSRPLLYVRSGERATWAWFGGRRLAVKEIERLQSARWTADVSLAIGEPGRGVEGWRLTHHQARAALSVALRKPQRLTQYADCPLLAAALQNDTLTKSLKEKYLTPLGSRADGAKLRRTLRAYINAECNATSAANPLGVGRHAVENRVHMVEELLGRPLRTCLAELDVALRLEELDGVALPDEVLATQ